MIKRQTILKFDLRQAFLPYQTDELSQAFEGFIEMDSWNEINQWVLSRSCKGLRLNAGVKRLFRNAGSARTEGYIQALKQLTHSSQTQSVPERIRLRRVNVPNPAWVRSMLNL